MARNIGGGFKNVGLVYIDVTGVSRRAILKSVAKGMVVGKVKGGGEVIVGGGDGGDATIAAGGNGGGSTAQSAYGDSASVSGGYSGKGKMPSS